MVTEAMRLCEKCTSLIAKPANVAPHVALVRSRRVWRDDGVLESYICSVCASVSERLIPRTAQPNAKWQLRSDEKRRAE
jgi:hypothetical protein